MAVHPINSNHTEKHWESKRRAAHETSLRVLPVQGLDLICFRDDVDVVSRKLLELFGLFRDVAYFFKTQGNDVTQLGSPKHADGGSDRASTTKPFAGRDDALSVCH